MHKIFLVLAAACFVHNTSTAQTDSKGLPILIDGVERKVHQKPVVQITNMLEVYEDSLVYFADSINLGTDDEDRSAAAQYMIRLMKPVLFNKNSFNYPFTKLKERISILEPKDKAFRIYNWDYVRLVGSARYYGVIQFKNGKYYPLIDVSENVVRQQEDSILKDRQWFGATYYNIVEQADRNGNQYFLLGFNKSTPNSHRKVVEALRIVGDSAVIFGAPIFESAIKKGKMINRFVLEYDVQSKVACNWDTEKNIITFDHLESRTGEVAKRHTYMPDGTYDGLRWNGKIWQIVNNVVQVTPMQDGDAPKDASYETNPNLKKMLVPENNK
jgi:hypothetical protein